MALTETEVCMRYITPALEKSGWDKNKQILREYSFTDGRVIVRGKLVKRGTPKRADYILQYKSNIPLAIVEAKKDTLPIGAGMQQGLEYAEILDIPFVYSSNGKGFIEHDRATGLEKEISLEDFPTPDELWNRFSGHREFTDEQEKLYLQDYFYQLNSKSPRYYQRVAINRAVEAVAKNQKRILLVMATGTGKTFTAFQIIHRLWKAGEKKRILFLADRNILVDQTITGDFSPFGDKMTKIQRSNISYAHEIYLALYQSMTGTEDWQQTFREYSSDFFDLVVIDECHRGSAKDNSAWRVVLEYFNEATHLGLTATPKEDNDVSTQGYFGEPIYSYSLKQGIQDGFLAPYKVIRMGLDKDLMGFRPLKGQTDKYGQVMEDREYYGCDFDKDVILEKRHELVAKEISRYMKEELKDRFAKTIVFCQDIEHAENMRKALSNENADLVKQNHKYVMRITGDNPEGKLQLDNFIEPTETYPVIATTSRLMTTGVDAKTCKLIVIDMNIGSMTEFKQIIGRGTRLRPDFNKFYFTIMDFRGATRIFADPGFDGDPEPIDNGGEGGEGGDSGETGGGNHPPTGGNTGGDTGGGGRQKFYVNDVEVTLINKRVQYLDANGKLVSESYKDYSKRNIKKQYATLDDFIKRWSDEEKKQVIYDELLDQGIVLEELRDEIGKDDIDDFDLICHIAFDMKPLTKAERINNVKKRNYFAKYGEQAREVLEILLDKYMNSNIIDIEDVKILKLDEFKQIGMPGRILKMFGGKEKYLETIKELEAELYRGEVS
ncbi:EcoAI/FtnUII family type I restriction enzme subunit R [Tepidibacter hydrothermalis]|uniref:DEAD/DEAH box helicase family protein n=1 Tax=Tepidibacter hydrothermalis TaxID=3036126 RepID=A0ABY8EGI0_9FIRM|nr:DEAD/DEAH box helicase family protein [Tepidibacter hydrothermalis]WFD10874.1 DEAD/DEAH box helicase family protein [Tepidibacter hydrothermalis]